MGNRKDNPWSYVWTLCGCREGRQNCWVCLFHLWVVRLAWWSHVLAAGTTGRPDCERCERKKLTQEVCAGYKIEIEISMHRYETARRAIQSQRECSCCQVVRPQTFTLLHLSCRHFILNAIEKYRKFQFTYKICSKNRKNFCFGVLGFWGFGVLGFRVLGF